MADADEPEVDEPPVEEPPVVETSAEETVGDDNDTDLSTMPPPAMAAPMAPPLAAAAAMLADAADEPPTGRATATDRVLDPRAMRALSRQERKDAKASLRREQKEAREAARRAKADAKADAKAGDSFDLPADEPAFEEWEAVEDGPATMPPPSVTTAVIPAVDSAVDVAEPEEHEEPVAVDPPVVTPPAVTPTRTSLESAGPPPSTSGNDPRSRAAARVQRRLGRDAEKVSAAEVRARAREEARRRRAQAKELRSGSATVEAAEAVVRMPDEQPDVTAEIPVVEDLDTQVIQPVAETPEIHDEIALDQPVVDEPVSVDDDADSAAAEDVTAPVVEEAAPEVEAATEGEDEEEGADPEADAAEFVPPAAGDPFFDGPELGGETSTSPAPDEMLPPTVAAVAATATAPAPEKPAAPKWSPEPLDEPSKKSGLGPIAGVVGLAALAISVLLAVSALTVALGVDSGGVYKALKALADTLVGPLKDAFNYSGPNAERKEHFLAWGSGSLGYLVLSFVGQAVQRANSDDD